MTEASWFGGETKSKEPSTKNTDPVVRWETSTQGAVLHQIWAGSSNGNDSLDSAGGLDQGVDGAASALRCADGPDVGNVQLVLEHAGIAIGGDEEICGVQYRLPRPGHLVLSGDDHETPGSHVLQKIVDIAGLAKASVSPRYDGMLEAPGAKIGGIV